MTWKKSLKSKVGKTKAPVGSSFRLMVCNSGNTTVGGEVKSTKLEKIKWKIKKNRVRGRGDSYIMESDVGKT